MELNALHTDWHSHKLQALSTAVTDIFLLKNSATPSRAVALRPCGSSMYSLPHPPRNNENPKADGGGRIRTSDTVTRMPVFETGTFSHSVTPPHINYFSLFFESLNYTFYSIKNLPPIYFYHNHAIRQLSWRSFPLACRANNVHYIKKISG